MFKGVKLLVRVTQPGSGRGWIRTQIICSLLSGTAWDLKAVCRAVKRRSRAGLHGALGPWCSTGVMRPSFIYVSDDDLSYPVRCSPLWVHDVWRTRDTYVATEHSRVSVALPFCVCESYPKSLNA